MYMWFVACLTFAAIGIWIQGEDSLSLRKDAVLLVKSLVGAADALLNKAGNWSGKDRLSTVLKKIKKDVSNSVLHLNVTHPSPVNIKLSYFVSQSNVLYLDNFSCCTCSKRCSQGLLYIKLNFKPCKMLSQLQI